MTLNESHILDYLDDKLDASDNDAIESKLDHDKDKSNEVDDARIAMKALHDLASNEQIGVSGDFWPRLRDQLPSKPPKRSVWDTVAANAARWVWPSSSRWAISVRVALVVGALAMTALWLGPQRTITHSSAISTSEQAFISRSLQQHEVYLDDATRNGLVLPAGDATFVDYTDESTASDDVYMP